MANNIINNNPNITRNITNNTTKYKVVNNTTNFEPKRNLGRGGLYGVDTANNWFGGVVETLTGFGVLRFFLLILLFLTFLRNIFIVTGVAQPIDLYTMLTLMENLPTIEFDWIDKVSDVMTSIVLPSVSGFNIAPQIFTLLWYPIKILLYCVNALWYIIKVIQIFFAWFALT